ncbi:hypothetical protein [Pelagibaculum spongiae]|uniref:hypothetical protein n=1 Tax=Pelagibaculum spongiae TaxID=2080658 RepID=UPI0013149EED|nr:hypothetical protein [Pelagibaculum spongiae]
MSSPFSKVSEFKCSLWPVGIHRQYPNHTLIREMTGESSPTGRDCGFRDGLKADQS